MTLKQMTGPAGSLNVDDGGAGGVPVVFIHSFGGDTTHWSAQLEHLRKTRRAVALDLRGHGQSESSDDNDYAVESLAEDLAAVVNELDLTRVVLVGHSMGAPVAIAYAGKHPQRVAGLLLVGAPGKVPAKQAQQTITALESDYDKVYEDFWNRLLTGAEPQVRAQVSRGMQRLPRETAMSFIKAIFDYDPVPALRAYPGPKLSVITPHGDTSNDLHRLVPDLPHKLVTGTSHWLYMDKPEEFNRILDEFLRSVETGEMRASQ